MLKVVNDWGLFAEHPDNLLDLSLLIVIFSITLHNLDQSVELKGHTFCCQSDHNMTIYTFTIFDDQHVVTNKDVFVFAMCLFPVSLLYMAVMLGKLQPLQKRRGHPRDHKLLALNIVRVHNSRNLFQSNVCNLFLPGI